MQCSVRECKTTGKPLKSQRRNAAREANEAWTMQSANARGRKQQSAAQPTPARARATTGASESAHLGGIPDVVLHIAASLLEENMGEKRSRGVPGRTKTKTKTKTKNEKDSHEINVTVVEITHLLKELEIL